MSFTFLTTHMFELSLGYFQSLKGHNPLSLVMGIGNLESLQSEDSKPLTSLPAIFYLTTQQKGPDSLGSMTEIPAGMQ